MTFRLRKPALAPPPIVVAEPWHEEPSSHVAAYFRQVMAERMAGLPFVNPALDVFATTFCKVDGDWLGAVVTPWCVQLMLLPGGGTLWQDIPAGERRLVALPAGTIAFIADAGELTLPAFQYCPLIAPAGDVADMATACRIAEDALTAVMSSPPEPEKTERATTDPPQASRPNAGRRAFLGAGLRRP